MGFCNAILVQCLVYHWIYTKTKIYCILFFIINFALKFSFPAVDFGSLFDLEHDLPDELISSSELSLANGGDLGQLHGNLGSGGGAIGGLVSSGQDAAAKHKQLSELLRHGSASTAQQQGAMGSPGGASMGLFGSRKASPGTHGMGPQGQQHLSPQQATLMQQQQMAGMVGNMNRTMLGPQKGNGQQQPGGPVPQQQNMLGAQMLNGSPRIGHHNPGMGSSSNLLAEALKQQQTVGGQGGLRAQQPGAMNKVNVRFCVKFQYWTNTFKMINYSQMTTAFWGNNPSLPATCYSHEIAAISK